MIRKSLFSVCLPVVLALSPLRLAAQQADIFDDADQQVVAEEISDAPVLVQTAMVPLNADEDGLEYSVPATSAPPAYAPLNLKQKYLWSMNEIFGTSPLLGIAVHAALDQAGVSPVQWGKSPESFAVRVASHFGDSFVRHNIEFGVRALDHEDPRYFRMGKGSGWKRAKYAAVHTFAVRNDNGGTMPAYSLFVTDYGMPYLIRQWRPSHLQPLDGFEAGTLAIGIGMGSNLLAEFGPDIKRRLPKRLMRGPLSRFADVTQH